MRETRALTLPDAVRKMTALPASIIGMTDRGYLAPGMRADVTVFDPAAIGDRATYAEPTLVSQGVRHVLVNGRWALRDGKPTGVQGGGIVLRTRHMPSRPMTDPRGRRTVSGSGTVSDAAGSYALSFAAAQAPGERFARGTIRLRDRKTGATWTADRLGTIQTTTGWTSMTAMLRDASGRARPATLTVDRGAASRAPGGGPVLVLSLDGAGELTDAANGQVRTPAR